MAAVGTLDSHSGGDSAKAICWLGGDMSGWRRLLEEAVGQFGELCCPLLVASQTREQAATARRALSSAGRVASSWTGLVGSSGRAGLGLGPVGVCEDNEKGTLAYRAGA